MIRFLRTFCKFIVLFSLYLFFISFSLQLENLYENEIFSRLLRYISKILRKKFNYLKKVNSKIRDVIPYPQNSKLYTIVYILSYYPDACEKVLSSTDTHWEYNRNHKASISDKILSGLKRVLRIILLLLKKGISRRIRYVMPVPQKQSPYVAVYILLCYTPDALFRMVSSFHKGDLKRMHQETNDHLNKHLVFGLKTLNFLFR